jgi:hypothetical protein
MIRKRAVWCTGSGANIADARSLVTGLKHYLQAGVKDIFAKGRFSHKGNNTYERIMRQKLFSYISTARANIASGIKGSIPLVFLHNSPATNWALPLPKLSLGLNLCQ